jgi:hypothetical protein
VEAIESEIDIVFNGDNSRTIALRQIKFGQVEK